MPIYIRSRINSNIAGPYEESKLVELRAYIQQLSQTQANIIEAYWVCGRRRPMLLAMYKNGQQVYPRNDREERQLSKVMTCLTNPGAEAKSQERAPRKISPGLFRNARKLPGRFACPAKIRESVPLQDFTLPRAEEPTRGEMVLGQMSPPIGLPSGPMAPARIFWSEPSPFDPKMYGNQ